MPPKRTARVAWDMDAEADESCSKSFLNSIRSLYGTNLYSDFSITCDGRTYHMHKLIVCPRSPVFAAMLRSSFQEGQNSLIDLAEDDILAVHCMIRYFYFHNYTPEHQNEDAGFNVAGGPRPAPKRTKNNGRRRGTAAAMHPVHHPIRLHAEVYVLADRYDIDGLKDLALFKFKEAWQSEWDMKAVVAAARIAYEWTKESDQGLRLSVIDAMYEHHEEIFQDKTCKAELQGIGSLMYDLGALMSISRRTKYKY